MATTHGAQDTNSDAASEKSLMFNTVADNSGDYLQAGPVGVPPSSVPTVALGRDGGAYPVPPSGYSEALGVGSYQAYRLGGALFLRASGVLPYFNQIADLRISRIRIYPPQFDLLFYSPKILLPTLRPFAFTEQFGFPIDASVCVVNDAAGRHIVPIKDWSATPDRTRPAFLPEPGTAATVAIGFGSSLQQAFDHAIAQLPAHGTIADGFLCYQQRECGLITGGLIGVHHYYSKVEFSELE